MANVPEKAPGRGGGRRILVIEDEFQLRRLVARLFTLEGFAVVQAEHGLAALGALESGPPPDLVLLDYKMPVMDGAEFLSLMRPQWPGLPVLLVTASPEAAELAVRHDCAGVVMKPFHAAALMAAALEALGEAPGKAAARPVAS